jgi:hypothetical protein
VHHLGSADDSDPSSLVSLCPACHALVTSRDAGQRAGQLRRQLAALRRRPQRRHPGLAD